jgi:hypothetical protein
MNSHGAMTLAEQMIHELNAAIDRGWTYAPDLQGTELEGMRHTPRWQALVARLRA